MTSSAVVAASWGWIPVTTFLVQDFVFKWPFIPPPSGPKHLASIFAEELHAQRTASALRHEVTVEEYFWKNKALTTSTSTMKFEQAETSSHTHRVNNHWNSDCRAPLSVWKPYHGIMPDFDSIIPYRFRTSNGQLLVGRRHVPPNWEDNPLLHTAGNIGAVHRDGSDELRVRIRTWIASHRTTLILPHRDISVRAQLMNQLEHQVRRAWPDQIDNRDRIQLTVVQPSPRAGNAGHPTMHILIEINRATGSQAHPILIAHREIDGNGPSDHIQWIPVLVESPIDIVLIHRICAPPCRADQMLIPQAGRTRRWMEGDQQREVMPGQFLPIWWDLRRRQHSHEEHGNDDNVLLQMSNPAQQLSHLVTRTLEPHVIDRWCAFGEDDLDWECTDRIKRVVPDPDNEAIQIVEWTPHAVDPEPDKSIVNVLDHGIDERLSVDQETKEQTPPLRFRTYGFFGEDVGSRDVLIEPPSLMRWQAKIAEIWNDFEHEDRLQVRTVHPQPQDPDIDAHVLVYGSEHIADTIVLLEVVTTTRNRVVANCRGGETGYQVAARAGVRFTTDSVVRFRHHGVFHYGHLTFAGTSHHCGTSQSIHHVPLRLGMKAG